MAANITLTNLANLQNETTAVTVINNNNAAITTAFTDMVSRSGVAPNTLSSSLDVNNNRILNLPAPVSLTEPVRLQDLTTSVTISISSSAIAINGSTSGSTTLVAQGVASGTLTVPSATDTLVGKSTTDTLINKTIDTAGPNTLKIAGTTIASTTGTGSSVVLSNSPTILNLTISSSFNATAFNKVIITPVATSATLTLGNLKTVTFNATQAFSGTDGTTLTFQGTDTYVGRATVDTLTNKTYNTAGTGNVFQIAGNTISSVIGAGSSVVLSFSPTFSTSILLNGTTSGTITFNATTGTYTLALPTTAGTSGQILVSQAGSSSMTWAGGNSSLGIGFVAFSTSLGTISSSFTLDPTKANFQTYTNGGAHTLNPTTSISTMVIDVTNNASAGAITTTNFTKVDGDSMDTVNTHSFRLYISVGSNSSSHLNVKRMI